MGREEQSAPLFATRFATSPVEHFEVSGLKGSIIDVFGLSVSQAELEIETSVLQRCVASTVAGSGERGEAPPLRGQRGPVPGVGGGAHAFPWLFTASPSGGLVFLGTSGTTVSSSTNWNGLEWTGSLNAPSLTPFSFCSGTAVFFRHL